MDQALKTILISLAGVLAALTLFLVTKYEVSGPALGGVTPGLSAGTTTVELIRNVTATASTIFEARRECASRIINTASTTLMISFGSSSPTAIVGHWQAASTSVAYDGAIYGCGQWRAIAVSYTRLTLPTTPYV